MKKILLLYAIFLTLLFHPSTVLSKQNSLSTNPNTSKVTDVSIYVNNKKIINKTNSIMVRNQNMVPALPVIQKLGGSGKWNSVKERLDINFKNKKFVLYANKRVVYVEDKRLSIDTAPKIVNGIPMVTLQLINQITGSTIQVDKNKKAVYLGKINNTPLYSTTNAPQLFPIKTNKIVVIDPGHGGEEAGASYGGINEKDLNLDVSLRLNSLLKNRGIKVYMTRSSDETLTLKERSDLANKLNASLFVSVHHNALPNNALYSGTETLYNPLSNSLGAVDGKRLAQITQNELVRKLSTANRGIKSRPELSVLRHSTMPSIIAEVGYMSNTNERNKLKNANFRQQAAEALCSSILKALNEIK